MLIPRPKVPCQDRATSLISWACARGWGMEPVSSHFTRGRMSWHRCALVPIVNLLLASSAQTRSRTAPCTAVGSAHARCRGVLL